jgi:hypothetical protein
MRKDCYQKEGQEKQLEHARTIHGLSSSKCGSKVGILCVA